jgi:xylulokinase
MNCEILLGIDIGGTNIRACLFSCEGEQVYMYSQPTMPAYVKWDDPTRQDIALDGEILWQIVCQVCKNVGNFINENGLILRGAAVAGVGCSTVCLDQNNKPMFPIYRSFTGSDTLFQQYFDELGPKKYYEITGYPLEKINLAFSLANFQIESPKRYAQIDAILSVSDFINFKLCGERNWEYSTSTSFSIWDHRSDSWWRKFLNDQELDENLFGNPVWSGTKIGVINTKAAENTHLPLGTPIVSGGHDYLCAALAAGCIKEDSFLNIIGTYEIVASFHASPETRKFTEYHRTFIDKHVIPHLYSFSTERVGSVQLDWVSNLIFSNGQSNESNWDAIYDEINQLPDPFSHTNEIFVPYVLGKLFPSQIHYVRGGYLGVSADSTPASLLRATIEAICFESKKMIGFQSEIFGSFDQVIAVGGATQSDFWIQTKANILNKLIKVPQIIETTAYGAALLAGIGAGVYKNADEAIKVSSNQPMKEFTPQSELNKIYEEIFHTVYIPLTKMSEKMDLTIEEISRKYYDQ